MSKTNVVSFAEKKAELQTKADFLDFLHDDIKNQPESIQPIPAGLLNRIQSLRLKAEQNRRSELLEG
ncbi:hypothetical protein GHO25_17320 [Pseudomonas sp. FSL R10-1350]|uniref:hypothetical protein n=1 Tax=Pseudomonas TaxID=286 RepID=UPI0012976B49|nr:MULTISPECIES: hypothetical protein [Pseudomonas]MCU1754608.1 hypothetical protein [Pseudomonas helleri]MQT41123.1 hypothetical protein [Pseudomonas sp. FSL R10-0765]MQT54392.1 hypothetical protein [Pseudomonas sp. FSL R10-2398]MQU01188.1 hypothetical protein [Pseudomonas sp. FSL R10-2245]MQU13582.1 hypothetical protein [Pseudomonas sp. FSL R10-2189]